jgi:hypothetical protein
VKYSDVRRLLSAFNDPLLMAKAEAINEYLRIEKHGRDTRSLTDAEILDVRKRARARDPETYDEVMAAVKKARQSKWEPVELRRERKRKEAEDVARSGLQAKEDEANEFGFWRLPRDLGKGLPTRWRITCSGCQEFEEHAWDVRTSPAIMVRNLRHKNWEVDRKRPPKCPKCSNGRETGMTKTATLGPDPKLARKIYAALDDHFDDVKKRFAPGWDDQRIAKELDVSPELVIRIRREAYGELAEDPAISVLRDDVELLKMELADASDKLGKEYAGKLDDLRAGFATRISNVEGRLGALLNRAKVA